MITDVVTLSAPDINSFNEKLEEGILILEKNGCTDIEVQYKPLVLHDEFDCIVYTALLVGRSNKNERS